MAMRRTNAELRAEGAAAERAAIAAFARSRADEARTLAERGKVTAHEGSMLVRRLTAFAEAIEAGLHG